MPKVHSLGGDVGNPQDGKCATCIKKIFLTKIKRKQDAGSDETGTHHPGVRGGGVVRRGSSGFSAKGQRNKETRPASQASSRVLAFSLELA